MSVHGKKRRWIGGAAGSLAALVCLLCAVPATAEDLALRLEAEELPRPGLRLGAGSGRGFPTLAAPQSTAQLRLPDRASRRDGFFDGHLMPRMTRQLAHVSPIHLLEVDHGRFANSGMDEWVAATAARHARRAARKALRDYVEEVTRIGSFVDDLRVGRRGLDRPTEVRAVDYRFGVSHGIPRIAVRHRSGAGTTRFSAALDGSLRLDFSPAAAGSAWLQAGYSLDSREFVLSYRHGF